MRPAFHGAGAVPARAPTRADDAACGNPGPRLGPSPALAAAIENEVRTSVARRLEAAALARRATLRSLRDKALRDAGVPLDRDEWAR